MSKPIKRIAVTGGAGQIAYSLLFRIAAGEMLGKDQPIALHILETAHGLEALRGIVMELEDCAFDLLREVKVGDDPYHVFQGVDIALLVGAKPRTEGMERRDLLAENAKIFIHQGKALNDVAHTDALVLVVGNPCNTNALIVQNQAPNLLHIFSMTRLDQNRAAAFLAQKADVPLSAISHVTIWGNHSSTLAIDLFNTRIAGRSAREVLDRHWLEEQFIPRVQKRGTEVLTARGKSSSASAAQAIIDTVRSLVFPTKEGEWFSCGLSSHHNPYGIKEGFIFSFPCLSYGDGNLEVIKGLHLDEHLKRQIAVTEKELLDERGICNTCFGGKI